MAGDLTGYRNYLLSKLGNEEALQNQLREEPRVDIMNNGITNQQQSVNIMNPNMNTQQYNPEELRMQSLNTEVETGLGTRIDKVMSDSEKQRYLNSLTDEQYQQMLQYKNEGYGFMASKALLENSYKLADPTATGLLKYNDYAKKDAYYNNSRDLNPDSTLGKFATWLQKTFGNQTPTEYLANWWNTKYGEKVEKGEETFFDRFGNMTFGALLNMLDTGSRGAMGIMDKASSSLNAKLDRDILGIDTDNKFYRTMDTNLVSDITKYVGTAIEMAVLGKFTFGHPLGMLTFTTVGSTGVGDKVMDLTIGNIGRVVNWTLDTIPGIRAGYNTLDDEAKETLVNDLTLGILHGMSKEATKLSPKLAKTKIGNYVGEVRTAVRNSLERGVKQGVRDAKIQAEVEKKSGTKQYEYVDPETGETGTFDSFEGYDKWYRERVARAGAQGFREGFWNGVYEEFQNVGSNRGRFGSDPSLPGEGPGYTPKGSGGGDGASDGDNNVNGNNYTNIVGKVKGTIGENQLATENRMTKGDITKFNDRYGTSYTQWLIDRGFTNSYENNIQDLIDYSNKVQQDKEDILKLIPTRYTDSRVKTMLNEVLEHAEYVNSPELSKIQNLVLKYKQGGLTPLDVEYIRKYFSDYLFKDTEGKEAIRLRNVYDGVKNFLEEVADKNGFSEYRDLNKEISATEHIIIGTTRRANGIMANQQFGLKDAIILAGNMANPKTWSIMGFRLLWKNPEFKDKVLNYLLKGRKPKEKKQIKVDFEKIMKQVEENRISDAQKQYEEFMKKRNIDTQPIENALGYNPEAGEFIDYSTPTMVTPEGESKRWGQIAELKPKQEIKRPGTTKPAEKIVESVVKELVREGVLEKEVAETVKENLLDNLSQQAQEKLAEVEQKIENGEELAEEEQKIVEKVADTIEDNKEDLQAKRIREFNENFEKQVDNKKLDEIREFVNEGGELKIVPIGIRKTVQLKNHGVMLSKAELDILKDEGLITDKDIPERNDELVVEREQKGPTQIQGWYPIEGQTITVKSQPKEYQPTDSEVDKFVLDNMGNEFESEGSKLKIHRFADNGNIVGTVVNPEGDNITILVLDKNDIMDKVKNGVLKPIEKGTIENIDVEGNLRNTENKLIGQKQEPKQVQRDFKQGTLESENDIVEKIQNKEYGRFLQEVDGVIKLGLYNSFNNTSFQVASGDWQTAIKADITRDDKGEKVRFELGENTVQESIDTFNDILKKLKIQYIVGFKDENGQKVPTVMYKKTGHNDTMQMGKSFNGVATSKEYRLGDTDFTIQMTDEEKLQLEIDRVAHQSTSELTDLKRDVAKNEKRAEQAKLAEKRAGLQAYVDENYKAGIARTRAMQELTKPIYEGYVSGKGYVRNLHYYDLPENTEVREALDDLSKYNGEIKEVWERDYVDKNGERHDVYSYWYDYKDDPNAKTGHRIGLTKYQRDYLGYKLLQNELAVEEKDVAENPDKYITAEQEAYLYGEKPVEVETKEVIGSTDTMNELQDKINAINSFDDLGDIFEKTTYTNQFNDTLKTDYYYGKLGGKDIVIGHDQGEPKGSLFIGDGIEFVVRQPIIKDVERYRNPITLEQLKAKLLNADDEQINAMSQTVSWGDKKTGQIKESDYNTDNLQSNTTTNGYNGNSGEANQGQDKLSDNEQVLQLNDGGAKGVMEEVSTSTSTKTLNKRSDSAIQGGDGLSNATSTRSIWTKGDNVITSKTTTQARDINRDAVKILEDHKYSTNANDYTEAEKDILRQYEGRGGINDKTDINTQGALNQYYTKDNIIKAMWRLVDKYNNADILEPSMGTGRFFMYAPEGSNLYGFEYDKIPGTIAKILYPNANIVIGDFQQNFMVGKRSVGDMYTGRKYDLVIGNPPYEDRGGTYMGLGEEPKIGRFDDYFIKRGIDMLKPGGHLIYVTSSQFLRGGNNYAKDKISEKAQLIDAYRIPINAFDRTGVETDIILLERTEDGGDVNLLSASKWYDQHPEKILGTERNDVKGRFGNITAVVGDLAGIDEIGMDNVEKETEYKFVPNESKQETPIEYKNMNLKPKKASSKPKTKRKEIITGEWTDWTETREGDNGETETIVWGKSYKGVLYKGKENTPTGKLIIGKGGIGKYQNVLNSNGKIGDPNITLESDKEGLNYINGELEPNILYASGYLPKKLEILEEDYSKGNIDERQYNKQKKLLLDAMPEPIPFRDIYWSPYTERILNTETNILKDEYDIEERAYVEKPQTIKQLFVKRVKERKDELGTVTVIRKDSKTGMPKPPVEESLAEGIINALYGNKLADEMKEALTTKMPQYFDEFMKGGSVDELTKQQMEEEFNRKYNSTAVFNYGDLGYTIDNVALNFKGGEFKPSDIQARGVSRILTTESIIIAHGVGQGKTIEGVDGAIASMQQGKATKALIVVPGGTKAERMQTIAMRAPTQEIVDLGTLSVGSGTRDRLADAFGPDPRNWIQPGQIAILEHSAVGRQISFKEDTLAMLQDKLTDVTNQPFSRETELHKIEKELDKLKEENQDYYISNSQLEKNKKKIEKLEGQLESTQSTTEALGKTIARYTEKGLDDEGITTALGYLTDSYDDYLSKMEEYINNNYSEQKDREKAIKVANKIFVNERPIYLEDLGIDHITVDEAHNFRNLFNKAIQDDEEGNGNWRASVDTEKGSGEAMTLYGMTQYIMDINGGGNVILLTATPFINNPSEVYNMLSYVGKNGMEEMGVSSIDDFFDTFVGLTSKMTSNASGTDMKRKSVMVKFNNTQALVQSLLDRYIDYEGESETIVKPRLNTYVARLELSPLQKEIEEKLEVQIEEGEFDDNWRLEPIMVKDPKTKEMVSLDSTRKRNDRGETQGGVLEGMTQANSNLVSPYLTKYLKNKLPDLTPAKLIETSPKLQFVVDYIKAQRDAGILRGVFVYMPVGVELHELFKQAIEDIIPGIRVGIINGNTKYKDLTDKQAEALGLGEGKGAKARQTGKKFHNGELDVLIGGESTKEGLNLQGNGYVTIEVSQPRNANDRIQLLGRVDRQGNLSNEVLDLVLLMENSSDIYRYELLGRKNSRWSLLEMLAAYKRGEEITDVVPQSDLNFEEQQLALFTEPERKAKISIFIDKEALQEELNKIRGRIAGGENIMSIISQRDNYRGVYKEFPSERDLKDENGNIVSVDIFSDKALEPLEQLVKFRYEQAVETARRFNPNLNKAEIDKMIRKNSPRRYEFSQYNEAKISLNQARGDRDSVIRQMDVIGLKSKEELQNYLTKLHDDELVVREKINNIEKTKDERVAEYRRIKEQNEQNVMRIDDIIIDLMEEFEHQMTLGSKLELRNWLKVTQNLPKRKQAESREDIRSGRNKYEWKSEDYVGIEPEEGTVVLNKIPSSWSEYSETNIKPEFDFKGFIPKATIKKADGTMLTKFGYQSQLRQGYKNILAEEKGATEEELEKNQYYQTLLSRAKNNVLKFAKRYYNEIIQAFESERPNQRGSTNPDHFKDYINDYTIEKGVVDKIRDDIVQEGAEYIAEMYEKYLNGE